jgi:hypothetical protein
MSEVRKFESKILKQEIILEEENWEEIEEESWKP